MSWTSPRTWSACEVVTATLLNTHLRDNLNVTAPAVVTTKGDLVAGTGANAIARVPISASNGGVLIQNSACTAGVCFDGNLTVSASVTTLTSASNTRLVMNTTSAGNARNAISMQSNGTQHYILGTDVSANNNRNFFIQDQVDSAVRFEITASGQVLIGTSTCNANMTIGLTIHKGANNQTDEAIGFKETSLAHGMTTLAETNTFGTIKANQDFTNGGGLRVDGYTSACLALYTRGNYTTADSTRSTNGNAPTYIDAGKKSGTSVGNPGANENILAIGANFATQFIFDSDGDLSANAAITASAYDAYNDAHLVRALEIERNPGGIIRTEFDGWLKHNRRDLERAKIATFNDHPGGDGSIFVNYTGLVRLHSGAIWQLYTELQRVKHQLGLLAMDKAEDMPELPSG